MKQKRFSESSVPSVATGIALCLLFAVIIMISLFGGTSEAVEIDIPTSIEAGTSFEYSVSTQNSDQIKDTTIEQVSVRVIKTGSPSKLLYTAYLPEGTILRSNNDGDLGTMKGKLVLDDPGSYEFVTIISYSKGNPKEEKKEFSVGFDGEKVKNTLLALLVILLISLAAGYIGYGLMQKNRGDQQ